MNRRGLIVLGACIVVAVALVLWLGDDHGNEVKAFLRGLRRVL